MLDRRINTQNRNQPWACIAARGFLV